jgi:hypothetical protein
VDPKGRTFWIADAHRDDGKRFVVHADEKLTAFVELETPLDGSSKLKHWLVQKRSGEGIKTTQAVGG